MEINITDNLRKSIISKEKKLTIFNLGFILLVLGILFYCIQALLTAIKNTEVNSIFWVIILFVEVVAILYFFMKFKEHIKPLLLFKNNIELKCYEVSILDIDTVWGFDTIIYRPVPMMEVSWKEEDSLFVIESKKEKEVAELVRKSLLLYDNDKLVSSYIITDDNIIV